MADPDKGRVFTTPLGFVSVNIEVTISDYDDPSKKMTLIQDYITDMKVGYNIFTYMHDGFIEYMDKGQLVTKSELADPGKTLLIEFKFDMLDIKEKYISTNVKSDRQSGASTDTPLRIEFINMTAKLINDVAMVRDGMEPNMPIGTYLKDLLEKNSMQTGIWKPGTTAFTTKHFWRDSLSNIIEDIKIMDMRRSNGNLFTLFSDFNGKLHYMEISDLLKTVQSSASQNVLWCASFGHDFGLGFFTAPQFIASHTQFSIDIQHLYDKAHGYKCFNFNVDTKLVIPIPGKEGMQAKDLYQDLPSMGGEKTISEKLLSPANIHEYFAPYSNTDTEDIVTKISQAVASRPMAFMTFFKNNSMCARMGFFNPKFQIVSSDGSIKNGLTIKPVQEEPNQTGGIIGEWMVMGVTHYLHGTEFYTDVDLVRSGK